MAGIVSGRNFEKWILYWWTGILLGHSEPISYHTLMLELQNKTIIQHIIVNKKIYQIFGLQWKLTPHDHPHSSVHIGDNVGHSLTAPDITNTSSSWETDGSFHSVCIFVITVSIVCGILTLISVYRIVQMLLDMFRWVCLNSANTSNVSIQIQNQYFAHINRWYWTPFFF